MLAIHIRASQTVTQFIHNFRIATGCGLLVFDRTDEPADPERQLRYFNAGKLLAAVEFEINLNWSVREVQEALFEKVGLNVKVMGPAGSKPESSSVLLKDLADKASIAKAVPEEKAKSRANVANDELANKAIQQLEKENAELKSDLKEATREVRSLEKELTAIKDQLLDIQKSTGKVKIPLPNTKRDAPKTNRLSIKKQGNAIKFYVNSDYVGQHEYEPAFGNALGFFLSGKQTVAYHDLTINYLLAKGKEETIFFDDFVDNVSNWQLGDWDFNSRKIENGAMIFECKDASKAFKTEIDLPYFNTKRDFRIECTTAFISGNEEEYHYITFGGDHKNCFQFGISMEGKFRYLKYADNKWHKLIKATDSKSISR